MKSRLQEKYSSETVPALMKHFGWKNMMAVPKLKKVTVNIGLGCISAVRGCRAACIP